MPQLLHEIPLAFAPRPQGPNPGRSPAESVPRPVRLRPPIRYHGSTAPE